MASPAGAEAPAANSPAAATVTGPAAAPAGSVALAAADARTWLLKLHAAAAKSNFQGHLVVSAGGVVSSSRVVHYAVGNEVYESLEAMDGRAHKVLRHNNQVHMLWPQSQTVVVEKRETQGAWTTTPQAVDAQALESYELRRDGSARVAGREATVLWLQPKDGLRYAQRFWADRETGLMLRADLLAQTAAAPSAWQVLESTAFSDVEIGVLAQPKVVLQAMQPPAGYRVVRPQQQLTTLDAQGWAVVRPVVGFRLLASVLRGMENAGKREPVLHAVFSDGLALVSVFVEQFDEKTHRAEAHNQRGATSSLALRRGDHWFTVVASAPVSTLRLFAAALDKRAP